MTTHTVLGPRTSIPRLLFRIVSGRPLDGRARTNSSFLAPGTRSVIGHVDRPSRWSMRAGWERAAFRVGWLLLLAQLVAVKVAPWGKWLGLALAVALVLVVAWWVRRGYVAAREWQWSRRWVRPLALAIGPQLGVTHSAGLGWLHVPRNLYTHADTAEVRIDLPAGFGAEPGTKQLVADTVAAKLALEQPDVRFMLSGARPALVIRQAPQPPRSVSFAQLLPAMEAAAEDAPVIGLGVRSAPVAVSWSLDSAHLLVSAGSGGGKSTMVRLVVAQALAHGGLVVVADVKRVSALWVREEPLAGRAVVYLRDPADISAGIIALCEEALRRFRIIEKFGEGVDVGPRILLVLEELNAASSMIAAWWSQERLGIPGAPKMAPALSALAQILYLGRQGLVNVVTTAQLALAAAFGPFGPAMRENFGTRALARNTAQAARMLAPDVKLPPASRIPGRWQLVTAGEHAAVQVGLLSGVEAARFAAEGQSRLGLDLPAGVSVPELLAVRSSGLSVPAPMLPAPVSAGGPALRLVPSPAPEDVPLTLTEACQPGGPLAAGAGVDAVRKARQRDAEFPRPIGRRGTSWEYRAGDLERWARNRPRRPLEALPGAESSS